MDDFDLEYETALRFIKETYGVIKDDFLTGMDDLQIASGEWGIEYEKRIEQMKEYLRRKQDEMHKL